MILLAAQSVSASFLILFGSMALIVAGIALLKLHPFFVLVLAAAAVGVAAVAMGVAEGTALSALDKVATEFGVAMAGIGFPIAFAVVIGAALMESGSADKIVRWSIRLLGEKRAPLALMSSAFILGVPVFFDTVFFLMVPLARALALRTGRNYLLFLLAIAVGGVITHGTVPPTPGPLMVAESLSIDLGLAILGGMAAGILPALIGLWFSRWLDRRNPVELRVVAGRSLEEEKAIAGRDESQLPSLALAIAPVALPVLLIAGATLANALRANLPSEVVTFAMLVGQKNVALLIAAVIAVSVYLKQRGLRWTQTESLISEPLSTAGVIVLITAAGGAYGAMIRFAGIGPAVQTVFAGSEINYVLLAWCIAAVVRVAQGSATVAMITSVGIMGSLATAGGFGVHPLYIALSIGFGASVFSWMNDSGFWVFSRMSGLTQKETLRSWTMALTVISVVGLVQLLILSSLFPFVGPSVAAN